MFCKKRLLITLSGYVQGVGFRPFVYRLALQHQLEGEIKNTMKGVCIDVQGEEESLNAFRKDLSLKKPDRAFISHMDVEEAPLQSRCGFVISPSECSTKTELALLPDTAMCAECLLELFNPQNRRHHYPFIHCMSCGPRFSLFMKMPFDRINTTMSDFTMCPECQSEYRTPSNRRFYSQTNCCPACGPILQLQDANQNVLARGYEALKEADLLLGKGKIIALKNTGGFLLLVDAANEEAVIQLRIRKRRPKKPFALLMQNLFDAKRFAIIDEIEEGLLTSPAAPIVLLKKQDALAPSVTYESPYYGIMLAHNAVQHLLLNIRPNPLVATSGNVSGMPICITEKEAFGQLQNIADFFLVHNRRIMHRIDDSVIQVIEKQPMIIRRARGYIPFAIDLPQNLQFNGCILGVGGHLKNHFAIAKNQKIYLSQYMGNLESKSSCLAYESEIKAWESLLNAEPNEAVHDPHPHYFTTQYLQERKLPAVPIQHHRAHTYSGMLDNNLSFPFLSISWDGTGLGDDGTIWGGEAFIVSQHGTEHFATLSAFRLPGGEKAIREPRRSLLGLLHTLFGANIPHLKAFDAEELKILCAALENKINAPLCSSMGRFFDGMSALLDCCTISSFEGEAALALETLAHQAKKTSLHYSLSLRKQKDRWLIEWEDMIKQILKNKMQGMAFAEIAFAFHLALADIALQLAKKASMNKVLLTGGCMQNKLLLETSITLLRQAGFTPFWHNQIPPNDSGLAIGQIIGTLFEKKPCA